VHETMTEIPAKLAANGSGIPQVGPTLEEWDLQLVMCEKVDSQGNMVEEFKL